MTIETFSAGTKHVGFSPTRKTLLAPKRRKVFGDGGVGGVGLTLTLLLLFFFSFTLFTYKPAVKELYPQFIILSLKMPWPRFI